MPPNIPSLLTCSLKDLSTGLENGAFTSVDLVKAYLSRIADVDHEFRSVIETNPDALLIAADLDAERKQIGRRGLMHGIPILLKDNLVTLDKMEATCGSYALIGAKPAKESAVVTLLRKAGAIILGKANLAELVGFRSTSGCTGWSARGGQARGIYYPGMKASGSSTGSAIATALGLCFASVGTETVFSIVSPAERCGIVGFKPSQGVIPTEGMIYASHGQDTIGLLTRSVEDAADMMTEMTKQASKPKSSRQSSVSPLSLTHACSKSVQLEGVRIGVPSFLSGDIGRIPKCKLLAFRKALTMLQNRGAEVTTVEILGFKIYEALPQEYKDIILDTDLKIAMNSYLSSLVTNPQNINNLQHLIDFIKDHPDEGYLERNVAVLERAQDTDPEHRLYKDMLEANAFFTGAGGISAAMERSRVDVMLMPNLNHTIQAFAAREGTPTLSLPMGIYSEGTAVALDPKNGFVDVAPGIPYSFYIYGKKNGDQAVLHTAHAFEELTNVKDELKPYLLPKKDLADFTECGQD